MRWQPCDKAGDKGSGRQMKSAYKVSALVMALGLLTLSGFAMAQAARTGGGPVEVAAQDLSFDPSTGVTTLIGNASVTQDGAILRAPRIRVTYLRNANGTTGNVDKVYTEGETFYVTPTERVRGDRAVFDAPANTVQFSGNVTAIQGQNVLRGSLLTLNTKTRASTMRGVDGRVRAVFFPQSQPAPAKK
jgi:lipopolysaccharide export system protein LptA